MSAPQNSARLTQFTKVFTYRPKAIVPYLFACGAVTLMMGFFLWIFAQWEALTFTVVGLLSLPVALTFSYTLYLWILVQTAHLLVTEHGIAYSDRWVRRALLWSEVAALTRFAIVSKKKRGIALRLGLKALENWQELVAITRELSDAAILV